MTDSTGDPHVRFSLGLYLLGSLGPEDREVIEHHLASCHECQAESDELGEVVAALALLSEEEGREVVEQFGVPLAAHTGATSTLTTRRPTLTRHAPPTRPAGRRTGRLRPRSLLGIAGLVVVVLLSAGVFLSLTLGGTGRAPSTPVDIVLAAAAADTTTGAGLSVIATGHDATVTVRATVTGLHHDTKYQLYLVTRDGTTRVLVTWVGSDAPQDVVGEAPVRIADLSFFTLTLSDGTAVVSAYLPRPTPSASH